MPLGGEVGNTESVSINNMRPGAGPPVQCFCHFPADADDFQRVAGDILPVNLVWGRKEYLLEGKKWSGTGRKGRGFC